MITRRATIAFVLIFLLRPFFQMAIPGQIRFDPAISLLIALIIYVDTERLALPILPAFVCALIGDLVHSQFVGVTALSMLLMCYFLFLIKDLIDAEQPMVDALKALGVEAEYHYYGDKEHVLGHVFHCNMKLPEAAVCNKDEADFFLRHVK
ncbi:MAG: hypothetical protein IIY82_00645 [Firmicutes bacterium]|nr:hypothetical protein [Bacillota bacterium]